MYDCRSSVTVVRFFPLQVNVISSVNRFPCIGGLMFLTTPLNLIRKSMTLITDSCGMPFWMVVGFERIPFILIWMTLSLRKCFIKASMLPFILASIRASMIFYLCIVSYAFSVSKHTATRYSFFPNASHIPVSTLIRASVVERHCLKTYWLDARRLDVFKYHLSRLLIIFSRSLHIQLIKVIGL